MVDDLAFAHSAINWTQSNLPAFKERMEDWVKSNVYICRRQIEENPTHDLVLVVEREMLPLEVSAEFGAYINTIRSALDILAYALAQRHGIN